MLNILVDPTGQRKIADFRPLGFTDLMVLGRYQYAQAHEGLAPHTHGDMFEICLLDEGEQPYTIEGRHYLLRGGDLLIVLPNERHSTGPAPENRGRLYWLLLRRPRKNERFLNLPPSAAREVVDALLHVPMRHFCVGHHLKGHLEKMFSVFDAPETPFRIAELQNGALRFVLDVLQDARKQSQRPIHYAIRKAQAHVTSHLTDGALSLSGLARVAKLSLSHFKAQFKREVGLAPRNYIALEKVKRAKELLCSTATPVTEVSSALGFSSSQYFATVFKKQTGVTPAEYRKEAGVQQAPRRLPQHRPKRRAENRSA